MCAQKLSTLALKQCNCSSVHMINLSTPALECVTDTCKGEAVDQEKLLWSKPLGRDRESWTGTPVAVCFSVSRALGRLRRECQGPTQWSEISN